MNRLTIRRFRRHPISVLLVLAAVLAQLARGIPLDVPSPVFAVSFGIWGVWVVLLLFEGPE